MSGPSPFAPRSEPPRVAVVAADPIVRAALERALEEHGLAAVGLSDAEIAVVDVGGGARIPETALPIVALVNEGARPGALLAAGVQAVLRREIDPSRLAAALVAVESGLVVLDAPLARDALPDVALGDETEELTARERQVLTLLASGLSNRRIAARLGISEHTVKFHTSAILGKLGVSTRTEAVVVAAQRGLLWL